MFRAARVLLRFDGVVYTHRRTLTGPRIAIAAVCAAAILAVQPQGALAQSATLTVSVNGSGKVKSDPGGINCPDDCTATYPIGTRVTLEADPDGGQSLIGWSGCDEVDDEDCEVTMTGDRTVSATFTQKTHTLTVSKNPASGGTVASDPGGISCGSDCTEDYAEDTRVTLTAAAATGWTFTGWSGACSGTGTCTVVMSRDRDVRANFKVQEFTLTVSNSPPSGGRVASSPGGINCGTDCTEKYDYGTSVTLTATAFATWAFTGWSGACSGTGSCTVLMTADRGVTATFGSQQGFTLAVTIGGEGAGRVTSEPAGIACPTDCTETYASVTDVTLTAAPEPGSAFWRWSGDASGSANPLTVTVDAHRSVAAEFVRALSITTSSLRVAVVDAPYADTLRASGGTPTKTWSYTGTLAPGLALAPLTGVISGFPSSTGDYAFTVRVQSDTFRAEKALAIHVSEAPPPPPEPPPAGLTMDEVVDQLLTGASTLDERELDYLDRIGNQNGSFDVGDFRAYLTAVGAVGTGDAALVRRSTVRAPDARGGPRGP